MNFEEDYEFVRISKVQVECVSFCSVCSEIIAGAPRCEIRGATGRDWAGGMQEQERRCP